MPYLFLAAILVSFWLGGWAGYSLNESKVDRLERSIETANIQAINLLHDEQRKTEEAQKQAIRSNRELDKAHESAIKTINSLHADLADAIAARMRAERAKSNSDTLPESRTAGNPEAPATGNTGFSEEFARFLAERARLADELAVYADTANKFISSNCGIANGK
jgi:outer membrane murein-binding lipoprotein Lpp